MAPRRARISLSVVAGTVAVGVFNPARTGKSDLAEENESTGSMGRDNAPSSPHLPVSPMERILSASGPFSSN